MKEELIVSGRMNPGVDPILHIWGWEIPTYLFLGGLGAGILFFAGYFYLQGKEKQYPTAVQIAPLFVPAILVLGLIALFLDLHHKLFFWRLYTTIRIQSPMSWGAWTLMVVAPISFLWAGSYVREVFPKWDWKLKILYKLEDLTRKLRTEMAWIMIVFGVILGIYTGILLSAFNARPLWNTSILGFLFLTSGLSGGAAMIMWMAKDKLERKMFSRIDLVLIAIELFLIIHMLIGFKASTEVQTAAADLFLGGPYTLSFWILVVFIGMILPGMLEIWELRGYHIPAYLPAAMVLIGGIFLRFIITYAGQASRYLY